MSEFGIAIREARLRNNLSARELGRRIGKTGSYLSRIESSIVPPPSVKVVKALADELGEDYERLILLAGKIDPELKAKASEIVPQFEAAMKIMGKLSIASSKEGDDPLGGVQGVVELLVANTAIAEAEDKDPQNIYKYMYTILKQLSKHKGKGIPENILIRRKLGALMLESISTLAETGTASIEDIRSEAKELMERLYDVENKTIPKHDNEDE